jgi:aspartate/methionine/tyrosine aminotransferase
MISRRADVQGFGIDRVAAQAGDDPDVLRLENLDTDLAPPSDAIEATRAAVGVDEANSWLPFTGRDDLKRAVAASIERRGGPAYLPSQVVITSGEGDAMLDALLALTERGDEVILTDPTYAGMLNLDALRSSITERTRILFINNASFPTGWVANDEEWLAIATLAQEHDLWLLYWAGFEGVLYDGHAPVQPASLPGMRERTVTVGAPSFEQRMIAWRVGWIAAPESLSEKLSNLHIYNGLVASGHNQIGVRVALELEDDGLSSANREWQARRDEVLRQLDGLPVVRPAGGWSLLLDAAALGTSPTELSRRLLEEKVAATPMTGWGGPVADRYLRFVFSNEPVSRLATLEERLKRALALSR